MKQVKTNLICLLAFGSLAASMPVNGQDSFQGRKNPPPQIILNGLTSIFDDRRALFKVQPPGGSDGTASYYLAEGRRAGGIELLSVDMTTGKIKVNNHGIVQTVSMCQPPDLSISVAAGGNGGNNSVGSKNLEMSSSGGMQMPPDLEAAGAGQNSGTEYPEGNVNGLPPAAPSNDTVPGNDPGNANPVAKGGGYSLAAAREFEQLRLQTAAAVYDGTAEPIPLTPLTPPGTPPALIGPDRAWFPD
jgi:hypothetical protein